MAALDAALSEDEPLGRAHTTWEWGQLGSAPATAALRARLDAEEDAGVRAEFPAAHDALALR